MSNQVLATVDGRQVTEKHMDYLIQTIGPERAAQFQSEQGRAQLLEELINQELFYSLALEQHMEKDPKFVEEMEMVKTNLLKSYAIRSFLDRVEVDQEAVRAYFDQNAGQFVQAETVQARHILVKEADQANEIKSAIDAGLSFEEAAMAHSTCPSKDRGGDLGAFGKGQMVPEFEEAAFALDLGVVSDPVETQFGFHIIEVTKKNPASSRTFEEVAGQIEQHLKQQKQNELYFGKIDELKSKYDVKIDA